MATPVARSVFRMPILGVATVCWLLVLHTERAQSTITSHEAALVRPGRKRRASLSTRSGQLANTQVATQKKTNTLVHTHHLAKIQNATQRTLHAHAQQTTNHDHAKQHHALQALVMLPAAPVARKQLVQSQLADGREHLMLHQLFPPVVAAAVDLQSYFLTRRNDLTTQRRSKSRQHKERTSKVGGPPERMQTLRMPEPCLQMRAWHRAHAPSGLCLCGCVQVLLCSEENLARQQTQ